MDLEGIMLSEMSVRVIEIPYDLTYMWNLKNKTNKIKADSQAQRVDWWLPERRGSGRLGKRGKEVKTYKLVVTKQPQGCKVQHREHNQ